jgi:hypothetical protein
VSVILNIAIGLATSVISGVLVWLWERGKRLRSLDRRARFFGLTPGGTCLVVMNNAYDDPRRAVQEDVHAMLDVAALAGEFGCEIEVEVSGTFRGSNGGRTEFCVGGPSSNARTGGHLAAYLPGVRILPWESGRNRIAFQLGGETYQYSGRHEQYALIAKFRPAEATAPVVLVCGQGAVANRAAVHFLKRAHRELARTVVSQDRYCLLVRVPNIETYGHLGARLERDVTDAAFTAPAPAGP